MILYTRGDAFNGWFPIGDGIEKGFNGKDGQYFELLPIIVSVWLNTLSQIKDRFNGKIGQYFDLLLLLLLLLLLFQL